MPESISYEQYLNEHGELTYKNKGSSMRPLLRAGRDLFTVKKKGAWPAETDHAAGIEPVERLVDCMGLAFADEAGHHAENIGIGHAAFGKDCVVAEADVAALLQLDHAVQHDVAGMPE